MSPLTGNKAFRLTMLFFDILDCCYPYIKKSVKKFGIKDGMTVIDYGCGLGSYAVKIVELIGEKEAVYAIDTNYLAIEAVKRKIEKYKLRNIHPILISSYRSPLYAVDIHELAIVDMKRKEEKHSPAGTQPIFMDRFKNILQNNVAHIVGAIGLLSKIEEPTKFLADLRRIVKNDGTLIIDDGNRPRDVTKRIIIDSGLRDITEETSDHLKCKPRS
ncbi:MAG: methyltransferase domain-containing protein [Dehalococcoidia bacterium]|nr:MAG: methyltransferase domain-containing protein [Dehalococcoidia bacterium]